MARASLVPLLVLGLFSHLVPARAAAPMEGGSSCEWEDRVDGALTLSQALDLALCRNAEIRSTGGTVSLRAAEFGQARAAYWPTLGATVSEVSEDTRYAQSATGASRDTATTLYGHFNWRLWDFGGRHSELESAAKRLEAARGTRDATVQRVLGSVIESYYDTVTAHALHASKLEDETNAREALASAERRLDRGESARSDALQAQTALARATLESNRARGTYESSHALLGYAIGLAPGTPFAVSQDAPTEADPAERTLAQWLDEASRRHPAIAAARAELEAARLAVLAARASGRPTVDLQVNYYANGFPQQGLETERRRTVTAGIAVSIPLFDGFLQRHEVQAAKAAVRVREAYLLDTERVTLTEIVKLYSDASAAVANVRAAQELLSAAEVSRESSKRRYEAGAADMMELLAAQSTLADARQERVRSLAELRSARLRLVATAGVLSEGEAVSQEAR